MLKFLAALFLLLSPFTSYFAVSGWLRLPVMLVLVLFATFLLKLLFNPQVSRKVLLQVNKEDILLLLLMVLVWVSFAFGFRGTKSFNHALAYSFTFLLYFFFMKILLRYKRLGMEFVLRFLCYSAFLCATIIIIDWFLINQFGIMIRVWFVKDDPRIANMFYYIKPYFLSVGGVAEEPGSMAFFMNIICPLGLLYLKIKNRYTFFYLLLILYAISLVFLASSASLLNVVIALGLVILINVVRVKRYRLKRTFLFYVLVSVPFVAFALIRYSKFLLKQALEFTEKFSLSEANLSVSIRSNVWQAALADWVDNPLFGQGPGYGMFAHKVGYHSVYLTILADIGIFGFILFLAFIIWMFLVLLKLDGYYRNFLLVPFVASVLHFAVIGDFYHAPFWILIIVIQLIYKNQLQFFKNHENFYRHPCLQRV